ncbi:PepSY-associated TM helix domain-containing protein [uncultured Microscilla sp.]|uniref:PepSY-associated TM helix domain-containing protein n=1 Tax=uncultured Microscilla sp. TaxID=432653 RepID=UPI00261AEB23|nr:PepSY-associated TM helix domain-containing protein [uncultured Microscilla sp.]
MKKLTKKILWVHRYTGFALSLLFLFWFLSGFVMMYKGFPYLNKTEALARAEGIAPSKDWVTPQELYLKHNLVNHSWESISVVSIGGRPIYRLQDKQGKFYCFFANTGKKVPAFSKNEAKNIVSRFMGNKVKIAHVEKMTTLDQWTPRTRFLPYLPAYRVYLDDDKGTVCYVSSITGQLFQKLNTADKIWAWLGPIPHWIYFKSLRIHAQLWRDVIVALSLVGVVMCLTGLYMGIIRVRRKKGNKWAFSPYKKVWFKWHHYTGFVFGLFTFTWILSGLFSMNPWKWSPSNSLSSEAKEVWQGGKLSPELFSVSPNKAIANIEEKVSELTLTCFAGKPYYQLKMADGTSKLLPCDGTYTLLEHLDNRSYVQQVQALHPKVKILRVRELTDYDAYYYNKQRTKPLPVLKVDLADRSNTTYYINPKTAKVAMKYENTSRINRWVYHGLHSLDFPSLFFRRPLWDIVMMILLLGGTSLSITGLALTWKWFKRKVNFR